MTENTNPFLQARTTAESTTGDLQERNRRWWENLPMTYVDWAAEQRLPEDAEDFLNIERKLLGTSPFLREEFDFRQAANRHMLEIGCGSGALSCRFARSGAHVTAMDITDAAIAMAQRNAQLQGLNIRVQQGDAEQLTFPDDRFDYVFSWGVLHHTNNMDQALSEVGRVLKPGGTGLMMVYHRRSVVYYGHGLYWLLIKGKVFQGHNLKSVQDFYTDGYHHRYLTAQELSGMLVRAGLEPKKFRVTQYEKKIVPFVPGFLDRFLKRRFGMCLVADFLKPAP